MCVVSVVIVVALIHNAAYKCWVTCVIITLHTKTRIAVTGANHVSLIYMLRVIVTQL